MALDITIQAALLTSAVSNRVPQALALRLAEVESAGNPRAVSPAGARGLLQLMPTTGEAYGLKTEADFFDPVKNSQAGLAYLRKLYERFGKWYLALAAYNRGPGWLDKNPDYHKWPSRLIAYVTAIHSPDAKGGSPGRPLRVPTEVRTAPKGTLRG